MVFIECKTAAVLKVPGPIPEASTNTRSSNLQEVGLKPHEVPGCQVGDVEEFFGENVGENLWTFSVPS